MSQLTQAQISTTADLLQQLEPGFLPLEIFNQIARLVRLPMVDIVPIKWVDSTLHIGLIQREETDLWWPGMWHLPGTVLRSTDTMATAQNRLLHEEIKMTESDQPVFHDYLVQQSARGAEIVFIHTIKNCVFQKNSPVRWFPADKLPTSCIASEKNIINKLTKILEA